MTPKPNHTPLSVVHTAMLVATILTILGFVAGWLAHGAVRP